MTELTFNGSRPLSAIEREVVWRELQTDARRMRFMGYFVALIALALGAVGYGMAERGQWLMVVIAGATGVALGLMSGVMLRKRGFGPPELTVFSADLRCETRLAQKAAHLYVGPFRVSLLPGWFEFWPEGQLARVELCLPPVSLGATWVSAVLVSLPGIDIQSWHGKRRQNHESGS